MALSPVVNLAAPPSDTPYLDPVTGLVSWQWLEWLQAARTNILNSYGTIHVTSLSSSQDISPKYVAILASGTITLTLPVPDSVFQDSLSRSYYVKNTGSGVVTIVPDGAETIDGATSKALNAGAAHLIVTDGTNWFTYMLEEGEVGVEVDIQTFTDSGTWTMPTDWINALLDIEILGGGGGGGGGGGIDNNGGSAGGGGGGGSGGELKKITIPISDATVTVTIGAGGIAGTAGPSGGASDGGTGGNAGASTFGSYVLAAAGLGGVGGGGCVGGSVESGGAGGAVAGVERVNSTAVSIGVFGLAGGKGGNGGGNVSDTAENGDSNPGYFAGGVKGTGAAVNAGGGAGSLYGAGGAGGDRPGTSSPGIAGTAPAATAYGAAGGGGSGARATGPLAGGAGAAGIKGRCRVYATKIS